MKIQYKKGDILLAEENIIAHGCNCRGVMGRGVAKLIRDKYPKAYKQYKKRESSIGLTPGDVDFVYTSDFKIIANCLTQQDYFPRNKDHVDYAALENCMRVVKAFAAENALSVAIPKIGAGLAGGDWNKIEKILEEVFTDYPIVVYVMENK